MGSIEPQEAASTEQVLSCLLGAAQSNDHVLYVASNRAPSEGSGAGRWREQACTSVTEAARYLCAEREAGCTYVTPAWFAPGQGAKRVAVRARRWIAVDIDPKEMPGADFEQRREQAGQLARRVPSPRLIVDSGYGFHVYVLLPELFRVEGFDEPDDGVRSVELLGRALRLYLEDEGRRLFQVAVTLDHCHGAQRVWRVPGGWNAKAGDGAKDLASDRSVWRPVRLLEPAEAGALCDVGEADLAWLQPYVQAAEDEHDKPLSPVVSTLDPSEPGSQGFASASVDSRCVFTTHLLDEPLRRGWPWHDGDQSDHDFRLAAELARAGYSPATAATAIRLRRGALRDEADARKGMRADYVERTVASAFASAAPPLDLPRVPSRIPFPLEALPEPLAAFARGAAAALQCAVDAIVLPLLVGLGAAIGLSRWCRIKPGWDEPALLWGVVVLPSGSVKTPAMNCGVDPLRELQSTAFREHELRTAEHERDLMKWEQEVKAWKAGDALATEPPARPSAPVRERIIVSDTTIEALAPLLVENPRGLLLERDELIGWMRSFDSYRQGRGSDLQHWLSIHSAGPLMVDRKGGREIFHTRHAFVAIIGGVQPGALRRALTQNYIESGLAARLLFSFPEPPPKRWTDAVISRSARRRVEAAFARLRGLDPLPRGTRSVQKRLMPLSEGAKILWGRIYDRVALRMESLAVDDPFRAALAKLEGAVARIALILELTDWALGSDGAVPECVSSRSVESAEKIVTHFAREAERVYALLAERPGEAGGWALVGWIHDHGGEVTVRDVQRRCRSLRGTRSVAERALDDLVIRGALCREPRRPEVGGGHETTTYILREEAKRELARRRSVDTRYSEGPLNRADEGRVSTADEHQEDLDLEESDDAA